VAVVDPIGEAERNWRAHGWPEPDAMAAVTSVMRAHQILLGRVNAELKPLRLTFARYEVLALLRFSRAGELPMGKIGERLQVHPASVTNAIDRLERDGFVERVAHPTDGRTILARLTESGGEAVAAATERLGGVRFGAEGLDDDDARILTGTIERLRRDEGDLHG